VVDVPPIPVMPLLLLLLVPPVPLPLLLLPEPPVPVSVNPEPPGTAEQATTAETATTDTTRVGRSEVALMGVLQEMAAPEQRHPSLVRYHRECDK
jgi:hypothetical protein